MDMFAKYHYIVTYSSFYSRKKSNGLSNCDNGDAKYVFENYVLITVRIEHLYKPLT